MDNNRYSYENERNNLFSENGFKTFILVRDRARELLEEGGSFTITGILKKVGVDGWEVLAAIDMLVELGEIDEIKRNCAGQYRTFVGKGM